MRVPFIIPAAAGLAFDVVGLGQNSIDYVAVGAAPGAGSKQRLDRFACLPGGQIATATVACARLGWRARYLGSFGDDQAGRLARESLTREGIDVSAARMVPGAASRVAVILVDSRSGERTVLWYQDPALRLEPDAALLAAAVTGRLLLVDCDDLAASTAAARAARQQRIPTMVDVEDVRPGTDALLRTIDAIVAAERFPSALTGHPEPGRALAAIEREYGALLVCMTLGAEGSLARCGGREIRTPGFAVDCVDSTGAGDVFRGAFAAGCLRWPEGEIEQVLTYANAAAALNCGGLGARGGIPDGEAIDRLIGSKSG